MEHNMVPEVMIIEWEEQGENIYVKYYEDCLLLNKTASIVWKHIDGIKNIDEIINEIYQENNETDSLEQVTSVVEETLELFQKEKIANIRETMDFDRWLEYE